MTTIDSTQPPKLRVLLIAEMCNPTWTSVPLLGYNFARALARRPTLSVHLATHVRNRESLAAQPIPGLRRTTFVDNEVVALPMHLLSKLLRGTSKPAWTLDTASQWPGYIFFERELRRRLFRELEEGAFDIVHRVTPLSPTIPSALARRTQIPMLIGPLNGGLPWPWQHPGLRDREGEWLAPLRFLYQLLPYYRSSYARLAGVVSGSRHTATEIPPSFRGERFIMSENGIDAGVFHPPVQTRPEGRPFRFVSVGRLVPYKGFDLLLEALAGSEALRDAELVLIGDGPMRGELERLITRLNLGTRVKLRGWIDQEEIAAEFAAADAFAFPSLREFGGAVVLEAMASGLPSIVVDYGGPGELLAPDCGILIPMGGRDELILRLRAAMERLHGDPELRGRFAAAGVRRAVEQFSWDAKAGALEGFYRQTIDAYRKR